MTLSTETLLLVVLVLVFSAFAVVVAILALPKKHQRYRQPKVRNDELGEDVAYRPKSRIEFSKIIMLLVFATYFVGFITGVSVVLEYPEQLGTLLAYVGTPTAVSVGFYSWKAKAENCMKMQQRAPEGTTIQDISNL